MPPHLLVSLEITSQLGQAGICSYQGRHRSAEVEQGLPNSFVLACVLAEQKALAFSAWNKLKHLAEKLSKEDEKHWGILRSAAILPFS